MDKSSLTFQAAVYLYSNHRNYTEGYVYPTYNYMVWVINLELGGY